MSSLDPVVLFFVLGVVAGLVKSGLKIPVDFFNTVSIYLLLAIGVKGGIEIAHVGLMELARPALVVLGLGVLLTFIAFVIVRKIGKWDLANAISLAAHYGSVSAVTFAVAISYLEELKIPFEEYSVALLVFMEIPAIAVAAFLTEILIRKDKARVPVKRLLHEIFLGKSILLLMGGLAIGAFIAYSGNEQLNFFFIDLFKGFLALFILEMGVLTAERFGECKKAGRFLVVFGILFPLFAAVLGIYAASLAGLSYGGSILLATLAASASYIAAPAAIKITLPEANGALALTAALGVTFPFNILFGIRIYHAMVEWLF